MQATRKDQQSIGSSPETMLKKRNKKFVPMESSSDSIASSMLFSVENVEKLLGLEDLFEGDIVHLSFDCPRNLRKAFNFESKANGTSACKNLQHYMASYVATSRMKKHALGNTMSKLVDVPFVIERMDFNQYVQSRPRRYLPQSCERVDLESTKPVRVEKTKRPVIVKNDLPDYSKFSTEKLEQMHEAARNLGNMGKSALIFMELKKRKSGVDLSKLTIEPYEEK